MRGWNAVFLILVVLLLAPPVVAVEMDELMDDVMDGVRQEVRDSIKQQVQQETREVLAEEQVIPSNTLSGTYAGTIFDDDGTNSLACNISFGTGSSGIHFSGTCTDGEGNRSTISGTLSGTSISFTVTETFTADGFCPSGTETGSGSATLSGTGEPGTTISGSVGPMCGDLNGSNFTLTKT